MSKRALSSDALLAAIVLGVAVLRPEGAAWTALAVACAVALAWGVLTLHFPTRVELDDHGVRFHAYGRVHRFAWRDVTRVRVRRFLVKDRVLVRLTPAPAWRGRYWLTTSLSDYDALVHALETRARLH